MKIFLFILLLSSVCLMISSCQSDISRAEISPADRIAEIYLESGYKVWEWVLYTHDTILTAWHVVAKNQKYYVMREWDDSREKMQIKNITLSLDSDIAHVLVEKPLDISWELPPLDTSYILGTPIYALVSRSWSLIRVEGNILSLDANYIGYDVSLSGRVFTGALETDIVLETGESGTPIWTFSGWLIGVMSAVDRGGKRGYVVR